MSARVSVPGAAAIQCVDPLNGGDWRPRRRRNSDAFQLSRRAAPASFFLDAFAVFCPRVLEFTRLGASQTLDRLLSLTAAGADESVTIPSGSSTSLLKPRLAV